MHRYSRMHLSPEAALRSLDTINLEEKSRIAEGIALIAVIDHRRDFLAAGYSCMRNYCMSRLHMSEDRALRRIQVARTALRVPEVFEYLADGRLNVTTAAVLAPHLEPGTAAGLLAASAFQTKHEIARMLAERSRPPAAPFPPAGDAVVETTSCQHAPAHVNSLTDLGAPPAGGPVAREHAVPHVENSRSGRVTPAATGDYDVRLSITEQEHAHLREAQALLGHAVPSGDPALLYARAMEHYVEHLRKQRFGVKPGAAVPAFATGRGIPKPLRRLVWERDGARCTFVSADGHRCEETGRLEVDHITPVALGGRTTPDNLRLLCAPHNGHEAQRVFGKEHVERRRELAQRERARARVAAEACVARENARSEARTRTPDAARSQTRDAAHQARHDDIRAALRGLGYSDAEARRGAAMADAMPDASLEACVRLALTALTRGVVLRGERRARCMA